LRALPFLPVILTSGIHASARVGKFSPGGSSFLSEPD
jgi:hypothetical protein